MTDIQRALQKQAAGRRGAQKPLDLAGARIASAQAA